MKDTRIITQPNRREFLYGLGAGLGSVAFTSMLEGLDSPTGTPHHRTRAKRCIFLMMEGGPSHIDTFDPKPELTKRHLQEFSRSGEMESAMSSGNPKPQNPTFLKFSFWHLFFLMIEFLRCCIHQKF